MKLEEHTIVSSCSEYSRKAWYLPSPSHARKISIFLDGEFYVDRMDAPSMFQEIQTRGPLEEAACLFVSHVNGEARHYDYTCNDRYARFIAEDLVSWIRERNEGIPAFGHLLGGTSLSGLQAAFTSILYPWIFSATLCHSGSFWWNKEWLKDHLKDFSISNGRFWISVGDQETDSGTLHPPTGLLQEMDQISACERFVQSLRQLGASVHYHLYNGGHEIPPWKEELPGALAWLLRKNTDQGAETAP